MMFIMQNPWDEIVSETRSGQISKLPIYGLILMAGLGILIGIVASGTKAGFGLLSATLSFAFLAFFTSRRS